MKFSVHYFEGDEDSEKLAEGFSQKYGIKASPNSEIDFSRPFFVINGDYSFHDRTLDVVRNMPDVQGYVHVDNHDDIGLMPSDPENVGPANFVERILALGKKVAYVGQRYWSFRLLFSGRLYTGLMRNNLLRYKPIDSIYFIPDAEPFAIFYYDDLPRLIVPALGDIIPSRDTQAVYVSEAKIDQIPKEYAGKIGRFRPEEVTLFLRDGTPMKTSDKAQPIFLLLRKMYTFENLPVKNTFLSIDMDITEELPLRTVYDTVGNIARSPIEIAGGDIYGLNPNDPVSPIIVKKVLDGLEDAWSHLLKLSKQEGKSNEKGD